MSSSPKDLRKDIAKQVFELSKQLGWPVNKAWNYLYNKCEDLGILPIVTIYHRQYEPWGKVKKKDIKTKLDLVQEYGMLHELFFLSTILGIMTKQIDQIECKTCGGSGEVTYEEPRYDPDTDQTFFVQQSYPCPDCKGIGYFERKTVDLKGTAEITNDSLVKSFSHKKDGDNNK